MTPRFEFSSSHLCGVIVLVREIKVLSISHGEVGFSCQRDHCWLLLTRLSFPCSGAGPLCSLYRNVTISTCFWNTSKYGSTLFLKSIRCKEKAFPLYAKLFYKTVLAPRAFLVFLLTLPLFRTMPSGSLASSSLNLTFLFRPVLPLFPTVSCTFSLPFHFFLPFALDFGVLRVEVRSSAGSDSKPSSSKSSQLTSLSLKAPPCCALPSAAAASARNCSSNSAAKALWSLLS